LTFKSSRSCRRGIDTAFEQKELSAMRSNPTSGMRFRPVFQK